MKQNFTKKRNGRQNKKKNIICIKHTSHQKNSNMSVITIHWNKEYPSIMSSDGDWESNTDTWFHFKDYEKCTH